MTSDEICNMSREYLYKHKNTGIVSGMQFIKISFEEFEVFYERHRKILELFNNCLCLHKNKIEKNDITAIKEFVDDYGKEESAEYFSYRIKGGLYTDILNDVTEFLDMLCTLPSEDIVRKGNESFFSKRAELYDSIRK